MATDTTMTYPSALPVAAPVDLPEFKLYEILDTGELVERNVGVKNASMPC